MKTMKTLDVICIADYIIFIVIMLVIFVMFRDICRVPKLKILPKENFCTCRGGGYNNSEADLTQKTCYAEKIPNQVFDKSYAGCTSFEDPGKISYDYYEGKQLPQYAGV